MGLETIAYSTEHLNTKLPPAVEYDTPLDDYREGPGGRTKRSPRNASGMSLRTRPRLCLEYFRDRGHGRAATHGIEK